MKIGIDIDGVLTDVFKYQLDYGSKFYFEHYGKEIMDYKGYETNDIFGVEQKYDDEFWEAYYKDYSENIEVRKFASEVIHKLHNEGFEINIITARGSFLTDSSDIMSKEENKNIVLNWLKRNDIYYDKVIFSPEEKLNICKNEKIDIMIEDKPQNIEEISNEIPVICYHADYNDTCIGNNIYRCYSWYDIYCKIRRIKEGMKK